MKKCSYCGKVFPDTATACDVDRQPLWQTDPPQLPRSPSPSTPEDARQIIDNEHLKLLGIFHYIVAGIALAGFLFLCVHFLIVSTVFNNPHMWNSQKNYSGPPPEFFNVFLTCFYLIIGGFMVTVGVLNLLAAKFLRQKKHRTFSFVVAAVNCLQIPFGTALGIFTIIVLSRESVRRQYPE